MKAGLKVLNDILIDDSFIDIGVVAQIQDEIERLPWTFNSQIGSPRDNINGIDNDTEYTDYIMMTNGSNEMDMSLPISNIAMFLLEQFSKKNGISIIKPLRAKSNMTFLSKDSRPSRPHIDNQSNHFVFLYYVNDSDGDTIIYDNKWNGDEITSLPLLEKNRISPKAGRAVLFNGHLYHSWVAPQNHSFRTVINMNVLVE